MSKEMDQAASLPVVKTSASSENLQQMLLNDNDTTSTSMIPPTFIKEESHATSSNVDINANNSGNQDSHHFPFVPAGTVPAIHSFQTIPYTFRPAGGSSTNLAELFDLNEIFSDEFYPSELDFSKYMGMPDLNNANTNNNNNNNSNNNNSINNSSNAAPSDARWSPGFDTMSVASQDFGMPLPTSYSANNNNYYVNNNHAGMNYNIPQMYYNNNNNNSSTNAAGIAGQYVPYGALRTNNSNNNNNNKNNMFPIPATTNPVTGAPLKNEVILIPPSLPRVQNTMNNQMNNNSNTTVAGSALTEKVSGHKRPANDLNNKNTPTTNNATTKASLLSTLNAANSSSGTNSNNNGGNNSQAVVALAAAAASGKLSENELQEYQRHERRERNREHAKRSRVRKKLLLDSLQDQLLALRQYNMQLRRVVTERLPTHLATKILSDCTTPESTLLASLSAEQTNVIGSDNHVRDDHYDQYNNTDANSDNNNNNSNINSNNNKVSALTANIAQAMLHKQKYIQPNLSSTNNPNNTNNSGSGGLKQGARILMEPDYRLIQSLVHSQQNFVLSDPSLPDNPIVYASDGFCRMTGYKKNDVIGRNCRFLQGPGTDQAAVDLIRQGIAEGRDISVCLLNYKFDGKPFWNQFFLAALKDAEGQVVNYVGVQCEVNNIPVLEIKDRVKKLPIPADL